MLPGSAAARIHNTTERPTLDTGEQWSMGVGSFFMCSRPECLRCCDRPPQSVTQSNIRHKETRRTRDKNGPQVRRVSKFGMVSPVHLEHHQYQQGYWRQYLTKRQGKSKSVGSPSNLSFPQPCSANGQVVGPLARQRFHSHASGDQCHLVMRRLRQRLVSQ